jgi:hypothetical protein
MRETMRHFSSGYGAGALAIQTKLVIARSVAADCVMALHNVDSERRIGGQIE